MKFPKGKVYMIIPAIDLTYEMLNRSVSTKEDNLRSNDTGLSYLLETQEPIADIYMTYEHYDSTDILIEMAKEEWL